MNFDERGARVASLPTSRKVLCAIYGATAVVALVATWSANLEYTPEGFFRDFFTDLRLTPASRSFSGDLLLLAFAVVLLMVVEARKHGVKFVWLYVLFGFLVAISVTFPLFLIARELRIGASEPQPPLRLADKILLGVVAIAAVAQTVWLNVH